MAYVGLAGVMAVSIGLLIVGRRYQRGYFARHRALPPATWMFRTSDDPELEQLRRTALALLPIDLVAAAVYLLAG